MEAFHELVQAQGREGACGVDQDVAIGNQSGKYINLVQQRGVLNDERVGLHDRLAQPDLLVVDTAIRHHRRAGALGTETGEGLRMPAFVKCSNRQQLRRRHHTLAAAAMHANLEHASSSGTLRLRESGMRLVPNRGVDFALDQNP